MKSIKTFLSIVFLLVAFQAFTQNYELGKVTVQELEEKEHPVEKDAVAAILFSVGKTYFEYDQEKGFRMLTEVNSKIKIYKKEGYDYANVEVPIYVGDSDKESVLFSKVYTYNLENGKIEKTKLKSDGEFIEKTNKYWNKVKISLPNVKEGSVIEYKYLLTSPFFSNIPEWQFQKEIPVNYSKFVTIIPEYFVYNPTVKGYILPKVTKSVKEKSINYVEKTSRHMTYNNTSTYTNQNLTYNESINTYELNDLPSMKNESFVANIANYMTSVVHEISVVKYPNSPIKTLSTNWEDVTKTIYDNPSFGDELKKTGYFEKDLDVVLQGKGTRDEKIAAILAFVKSQVKWNNFNSIYCDEGVKTAYKNKTGNVAEINLMLTAMLRYAGLEANPILVSTRSNGIPMYPSRTAFNYVVAAVEIQDGLILLDATDANSSLNILPTRVLNWEGRLIRKEGTSTFAPLLPKFVSKETVTGLFTIMGDGSVNGRIRSQYTDYNAFLFRDRFNNVSKDNYIESLEKKLSNIAIEEYTVASESDLSKPVTEEFKFNHTGMTEIIGDKMYVSPLFFYAITENPFKMEKREYPIDFVYPMEDKYKITINIPEGYAVESVPGPLAISLDNNLLVYRFNAQSVDSKIQLTATLSINESFIIPAYYNDVKQFFTKVVENHSDKIVLKKIQ
jgi:hypothetical protein